MGNQDTVKTLFSGHFYLTILFTIVFIVMVGCGGVEDGDDADSKDDADTKIGVSATVSWSLDCGTDDLLVVCEIYNTANAYLKTGGPWSCSRNNGEIKNIPAGTGRRFILLAVDNDGNPVYRGEKTGITIEEGISTPVGYIETYAFVPELLAPSDNTTVYRPFLLDWDYTVAATGYIVAISEDPTFRESVIQEVVPGPPYSPQDLDAGKTLYWRVQSYDRFGIESAPSDIREFIISDPVATILFPENNGTLVRGISEILLIGDGYDEQEGELTAGALIWTSDIDGHLGIGEYLETNLSAGEHIISLTATNSKGYSGVDSIIITVIDSEI